MKRFILFLFMLILTAAGVATTAPQFSKVACGTSEDLKKQNISELCYGQMAGKEMGLQITRSTGVKVYQKAAGLNIQILDQQVFINGRLSSGEKIQEVLKK
jgi:hypothetical protein